MKSSLGRTMTARKIIHLTLVLLVPGGLLIVLMMFVLRSSFTGRFLKGATTMRKLAFLTQEDDGVSPEPWREDHLGAQLPFAVSRWPRVG